MKTVIYYFSATGNCLTTARILADELDGECIPLARFRNVREIIANADNIGFVFPIYYGDMPYLVRDAVKRMSFPSPDSYIFAFPTYRGHKGDAAKRLDDLLSQKGRALSIMLGVPMPGNSYLSTPEQISSSLSGQRENILSQLPRILSRDTEDYRSLPDVKPSPVSFPSNMRGIMADEKCTGCGRCAKVCPMENITIRGGKAVIGENCQTCLACFHWCPVEAIYMSKEEAIARREKYRHPDVTFADIAAQKR